MVASEQYVLARFKATDNAQQARDPQVMFGVTEACTAAIQLHWTVKCPMGGDKIHKIVLDVKKKRTQVRQYSALDYFFICCYFFTRILCQILFPNNVDSERIISFCTSMMESAVELVTFLIPRSMTF